MRRYLRLSALVLAACGTAQVAAASPRTPTQDPALALWHAFPVNATPRPIVPLGVGMVRDPASGFRSDADRIAYMEGHFVLRTRLPGSVGTFGRYTVVSASVAYHRLRATAVADRRAVAFTIHTNAVPVPPGEACPAVAIRRTATLHLSRPLGARVLISATDGGAVPVTTGQIKQP